MKHSDPHRRARTLESLPPVMITEQVAELLQLNLDYVRKLTRA